MIGPHNRIGKQFINLVDDKIRNPEQDRLEPIGDMT